MDIIKKAKHQIKQIEESNKFRENVKNLEEKFKQKVIVHVELDPDLLEKIDREAEKDLRTRKAQVLYILMERFCVTEEFTKKFDKYLKLK